MGLDYKNLFIKEDMYIQAKEIMGKKDDFFSYSELESLYNIIDSIRSEDQKCNI